MFFSLSFHFSLLLAIESEIIIEPIQLILRFVEKKLEIDEEEWNKERKEHGTWLCFFWRIGWHEEKKDGVSFWSTWELGWARQQVKVLLVLVVLMLWIFRGKKRLMPWCLDNLFELGVVRIPLCAKKKERKWKQDFYMCVACVWRAKPRKSVCCCVLCCVVVCSEFWLTWVSWKKPYSELMMIWIHTMYIYLAHFLFTDLIISPSSWSYQACVTMSPSAFIPFFILASYFYLFSRGQKKYKRNFLKP